jgi:hypothetical protein
MSRSHTTYRHSILWRQTDALPPEEIDSGGITQVGAAMRVAARLLWRDGYGYADRTETSITMRRNESVIRLYIQTDPAIPRK